MGRIFKRRSEKSGLPPGSPVYVGEKKTEKIKITIIDYDEKELETRETERVEECFPFKEKPTVTWINVDGLHEVSVIEGLGKRFGAHSLVIEDILNTHQRPKVDVFDDHIFLVVKMPLYNDESDEIESEQVSLILGENFVITFQEREGDVFDAVRNRVKQGAGRIRKSGSDYLAYVLADAVVDSYFVILEKIGERIEGLEEELISNPNPHLLQTIHDLKQQMIFIRKSVWPLREVVGALERGDSPLLGDYLRIYLRDLYDHTIQVIDTVETFRDVVSGMLDIYLSSVSNKMNEIMKVLTIFAAIFIPLTFIAGIYGMNFEYMPELKWHGSYFTVLLVMVAIGFGLFLYFWKKKWL